MPSQIRYAAPAYLTTPNASADDARIADSPRAAAATCTIEPVWIPRTETRPAARPWSIERVTM
jgi:hypothetical protein